MSRSARYCFTFSFKGFFLNEQMTVSRDRRGQPGCMEYRFHGYSASRYHPVQSEYAGTVPFIFSRTFARRSAGFTGIFCIKSNGFCGKCRAVRPISPIRSFDKKENAPENFLQCNFIDNAAVKTNGHALFLYLPPNSSTVGTPSWPIFKGNAGSGKFFGCFPLPPLPLTEKRLRRRNGSERKRKHRAHMRFTGRSSRTISPMTFSCRI